MRLGIIEWIIPARVPALHGFTIYDSRAVLWGTQTATAIITYGDAARAAIDRVAADYRSIT